jgi:hypothetical protein
VVFGKEIFVNAHGTIKDLTQVSVNRGQYICKKVARNLV